MKLGRINQTRIEWKWLLNKKINPADFKSTRFIQDEILKFLFPERLKNQLELLF
jgi:hypothetical protein